MTLLEMVKVNIRRTNSAFDEGEIIPLIEAAKCDLASAGIVVDESNALIVHAIILYVKANFGYDKDNERFAKAYLNLKISLALVGVKSDGLQ